MVVISFDVSISLVLIYKNTKNLVSRALITTGDFDTLSRGSPESEGERQPFA
jgi:hypothetical protein